VLFTTDVAAMASTSRHTVEREIRRGNLTAVKKHGRWLIDDDEAKRWAAGYQPYAAQRQRGRQAQQQPQATETESRA
jgi:hypothetical protein